MTSRFPKLLMAAVASLLLVAAPLSVQADEADSDELFGIDLGVDLPWTRVGTDAAIYESPRYDGDARLFVREKTDAGERWRVYRGNDYQRIVDSNPDLGTNASITVLGQKIGGNVGVDLPESKSPRAGLQTYVTAPGLTYETASYDDDSRLYVTKDGREYVYLGNDLDTIVSRYPHVKKHENFATLQSRLSENQQSWTSTPAKDTHSHVQVWNTPEGYTVRTWSYADGSWTRNEYQGESLQMISKKNPEAARHIGVWTNASAKTDSDMMSKKQSYKVAGAHLTTKSMKTDSGMRKCVVVKSVEPNSTAADLELKAGDHLLGVEGENVTSLMNARERLQKATKDGATTVRVRRDGELMTLRMTEAKKKPAMPKGSE